jgi:hypothetical protein
VSAEAQRSSPGSQRMALESRVVFELGAFLAASPLLRAAGRGDDHPVLVLPGFSGGDQSTAALRRTIRSQGYWAHGWRLGRNLGPTPEVVDGMVERLHLLHERHGAPVSLVGWSLGGMYARMLARMFPEQVRQVISLGSPYRMREAGNSPVARLYRAQARRRGLPLPDAGVLPREEELPPLPVPSTSIYTRSDGVIHWSLCIDAEGPLRENIEVRASHVGLGVNPSVLIAVLDRLAQPVGEWKPFRPNVLVRHLYPAPVWWTPRVQAEVEGLVPHLEGA